MYKKLYLLFILLGLNTLALGQKSIPSNAQISVLTIGPGDNLNDAFGHNGIRIKTTYSDIVYDFGRYNFEDPNFYLNFAKGKLNYLQGKAYTNNVLDFYKSENRSIKEQILNLDAKQKKTLHAFLEANYAKNKGAYLYDFFYDNCATKIRDVVELASSNTIKYDLPTDYKSQTFRDLIQNNLNRNTWGSLGIDIALGAVIDREATPREHLFLPENIYKFFEKASINNQSLVSESKTLNQVNKSKISGVFIFSPLVILTLLASFIGFITYKDFKNNKRSKWLDVSIHVILGSIGLLLCLLWFATDHSATANNYNLLWAFPISLIAVIEANKNTPKKWFIAYLKFCLLMLCLLTIHWLTGVQKFAPVLIPILIALFVRYIYILKFLKK
ncbi:MULTISPECIES: lipoprotein N-acyltransferase Lnb domain-containing protein [Mesoflavibacter]|uniref:DUF4105 domain-containing protein n=1 Tax=Mesoflavibacter profundi TaxID=2708110 RepID=A0ABT4RWG5_9FLAO|nr:MULTISPECIES: DUF4105 domain-containing protein [Mesoflavibacter]MDA0176146.1 DUF4105 domain-containing protein [Mesoflavibacter profundi]QIJ89782.1 hypothetical protein C7H62_1973 [Mesoflavibacter sp. HG96]QIJ92510.1 hypothetical protein C7H56_1973 [Mesoflavibacter sp. HG37]